MTDREPAPVPADPRQWAPMRPYQGRRTFAIADPLVEPLWSGTRVLVHLADGGPTANVRELHVIAEDGTELAVDGADAVPAMASLGQALRDGLHAQDAIIDGILTAQVSLDGVGAAAVPEVTRKPTDLFIRGSVELDIRVRGAEAEHADGAESAEGLVAVDLLRVDGTDLRELPLLERKRLLESVIVPGPLLRVSPHVRPPWEPWVTTWKSVGLRGGMLKAGNSRYHPNDDTIEWRELERLSGRR